MWVGKGVLFFMFPKTSTSERAHLLGLQQWFDVDKDLLLVGNSEFEGESLEWEHRQT